MKQQKRILALLLSLALLFLLFIGCAPVEEPSSTSESSSESGDVICRVFEDHAQTLVRSEYMAANRVKGLPDNTAEQDQVLPETRTVIIRDTETLNNIFTSFPETVDFSKETVVLYMFCEVYEMDYGLTSIKLTDDICSVVCHISTSGFVSLCPAYQRSIYLLMDAKDMASVQLDLNRSFAEFG